MENNSKRLILTLGMLALLIQGCTDNFTISKDEFQQNQSTGTPAPTPNPTPTPTPTPTPMPPPVDEAIKNCNDAKLAGALLSNDQIVKFEDTRVETGRAHICEFGSGDNLSIKDEYMRARYEQRVQLASLPANAVICDIQMQNDLQKFRYDDVFFLMYNDRILATNNKKSVNARLTAESTFTTTDHKSVNLFKYNWLALRDHKFENVADDYCLGKAEGLSSCQWPISEQPGQIKFAFNSEILIALGLKSTADQAFTFVITGDNDPSLDCYHEKLEFQVKVKYYIQQ